MGQALITRRGVPMLAPDVDDGYEQLINYTMLYNEGDECTEVTGGWTSSGYNVMSNYTNNGGTKNSDNMTVSAGVNRDACLGTANGIDSDGCNKIYVKGQVVSFYGTDPEGTRVYVGSTKNDKDISDGSLHISSKTLSIYKSDFVANTDVAYVKFGTYGSNRSGRVYGIWLTKPDNYMTLCEKAGVIAPSDLATLIANTTLLEAIFTSEKAVKFMCARCTGDFMSEVVTNGTVLNLLKASPHYTMVQANEHWAKFLAMVA